jgi:uncharacterized protein YraI
MPNFPTTGRIAALGGVVVASAAALAVSMAAPAMAANSKQTTCTDQVRVRSQPSTTAPVIGSCKAGEKVTVDETRGSFTHAANKQGWISSQYIASSQGSSSHSRSSSSASGDDNNSATSDNGDDASQNGDDPKSDDGGHDSGGGGFLGL